MSSLGKLWVAGFALCLMWAGESVASNGLYFEVSPFGDVHPGQQYTDDDQHDTLRISAGFTTDTAVAKDQLLNSRTNIGYEFVRESTDPFGVFAKYHGVSVEQIFGFGLYRTRLLRAWVGPSLRIAGGALSKSSALNQDQLNPVFRFFGGGGVATGVNLHTSKHGSAAVTLGYQIGYNGTFLTGFPRTFSGYEHRMNFGFAYYFRSAEDHFERADPADGP